MKKLYILIPALLIGEFSIGQTLKKNIPAAPKPNAIKEADAGNSTPSFKTLPPANPTPQSVIWSETFASGIPGTWVNTGVSDPDALWVYRGPATTPSNAVGGQGGCSAGTPLNSPTKSNGFIIFDSNYLDAGTSSCGTGMGTGTAAGPQTGTLVTDIINLTGHPSVVLKFNYYGRNYQGTPSVSVSGNGGTTYTQVWTWSLATNAASANPTLVNVNISSIAGNSANVKVKFTWDGNYYEMMVDDISIEDAPSNDLAMKEQFFYTNPLFDSSSTRYYTRIPAKQAAADSISFGAYLSNNGGTSQPNTKLTVNVTGAQTGTYASTPKAEAVGAFDSVKVTSSFLMPIKGNYNINFNISSDSTDANPSDNSRKDTIIVTDTVYARDNNQPASGYWYGTTSGTTYIIGNLFKVSVQDSVTSISIFIGAFTAPYDQLNKVINFKLYDYNGASPVEMASNDFYTITAADKGKWKTVTLTPVAPYTSTSLTPGFYLAGFESQSDSVLFVTGAGDPSAPILTTFVSVSTNPGSWGYATSTPFARMNTLNTCASLAATTSITNVTCNGLNNGMVNLTPTGGSSPYTFLWSNSATTEDLSNVAAGTYTVTITDVNGCIAAKTATVTQPAAITATAAKTNTTCGNSNGSASVTASGGTAPLSYLWSNGKTTATITGLAGGVYTITITDSKGCTKVLADTVGTSTGVVATTSANNASCGLTDGNATVSVTSGISPYTYLWSSNANSQTDSTATGLGAGTYGVTVTATGGCTTTATASVSNAGAPTVVLGNITNATCNGDSTGSVNITVSGGATPYTFVWSNGAATQNLSGVTAGTYTVSVTGSDNCKTIIQATITQPTAIIANATAVNTTCNGSANGAANAVASGGTGSLTYLWSNTATTQSLTGLAAGTYTVTVTDSTGCKKTASATVSQPSAINIVANVITETAPNNGAVNLTVSGGTSPFTYSWSNNATTKNITGIAGGTYTVTVTDANGCTNTSTSVVPSTVGISEMNSSTSYSIFPNPGNGIFNVQFSNAKGQYTIIVRNVVGQVVYGDRVTISGNSVKQIDLSNIGQGIYFMSVSGADINRTNKLVVK